MYYIAQTDERGTTTFLIDRRKVANRWWTKTLDTAFKIDSINMAKQVLSRFKNNSATVISEERARFLEEINLTEV